jgi:acyl-CoA reductase-like NAD-dependent aldehyde dehydrogenase
MSNSVLSKYDFALTVDGKPYNVRDHFDVLNPASEQIIASAPDADSAAVESALAAAVRASPVWAKVSVSERVARVRDFASRIEEQQEALSHLLVLEQGKPLASARAELVESLDYLTTLADLTEAEFQFSSIHAESGTKVIRRPLGVVTGITAWNYPVQLACSKLAMAVLTGNATVIKPSPYTPLTTLALGQISREVFPQGIVSVLSGQDPLGERITAHPAIAKIGFTGSSRTGCAIAKSTAESLKRLTLELGGNDAAIVLPDARLEETASGLIASALENTGQLCNAVKRVFVHESIKRDLIDAMVKVVSGLVVGDGMNEATDLGPIQNRMQFERLKALRESVLQEGGIFHCGEQMASGPGYFMMPAIISGLDDSSRLVSEEQFGPLIPVLGFDTPDEAMMRANASPFGLGASVWSANIDKASEVAEQFDAGSVWINHHSVLSPNYPSGGFKLSGLGVEYGIHGLEEYTQYQVIRGAT